MIGGRWSQNQLESLVISILIHLAIIFLIPYVQPAPTVDIFPLDFAGVIEISTVATQPAAPAPSPGLNVEVSPTPKAEPPKAVSDEPKVKPKPAISAEPVAKPEPKPEVKTAPKPEPEPPTLPVEETEVIRSSAGKSVAPDATLVPSPEAALPTPEPEPPAEPATSVASKIPSDPTPAAEPTLGAGTIDGSGREPASVGEPEGVGTVPRPEYPGDDPTGSGMIGSTGGAGHGVVIPKGVQNIKGQGEAKLRIRVTSDGKVDSVTFLVAPPDRAMERPIRNAVTEEWHFKPDTTPGRAEAYYLDVWVGYDGGTEDVSVKSEHVSYRR